MAWENLPSTNTPLNATNLNAIIENGSNANGYYIKFQDGTMIQCGNTTKTIATTSALPSGGYRSAGFNFNFPIDFYDIPASVVACNASGYYDTNGVFIDSTSITKSRFQGGWWSVNSNSTSRDAVIMWQAIGRWKA